MVVKTAMETIVMRAQPEIASSLRVPSLVCLLLLCAGMHSALQADTRGVVVSGLGGSEAFAEAFAEQGRTISEALQTLGSNPQHITLIDGAVTQRQSILDAIATQAEQTSDTFVLMLLGHGTVDSKTWRFNIAGRDITTEDLISALSSVKANQQLVVIATSASGALLDVLSQPGRTVVTATKSGGEINAVRFPQFLAEAVASSAADIDRNEILTIAEAFRYANEKTAEYYEQRKLLASEHPRLRGESAAQLSVARLGALRQAQDDPVVAALLDERLVLEKAFYELRERKSEMRSETYYSELEELLLSIAQLQRSIDDVTGWSDSDV